MAQSMEMLHIPPARTKRVVIVGGGFAGLKLARKLNGKGFQVVIIDRNNFHQFQPLFYQVATAGLEPSAISYPLRKICQKVPDVHVRMAELQEVIPAANRIVTSIGSLDYDYLVIATGAHIHPEETPGLAEHEWGRSIHSFYTLESSSALAKTMREFKGGRLVVNVVENPIKCPVAPLEFLLLADWHFTRLGIRDRVELVYATPLSGAFTKPIASQVLGDLLEKRRIHVEPDFMIERVEPRHIDVMQLQRSLHALGCRLGDDERLRQLGLVPRPVADPPSDHRLGQTDRAGPNAKGATHAAERAG